MTGPAPDELGDDAAWVRLATPLTPAELLGLCGDVARLLRLNPLVEYEVLAETDGVWRLEGRNRATGCAFATTARVERRPDGLSLAYGDGLKASTRLRVEPRDDGGADLVVVEDYGRLPPRQRQARLAEVDRSLVPWGRALHRHAVRWRRWSRLAAWRWWMDRVWLAMKPSARRVAWMVSVVTAAEFVAFLMVFTIYWLETRG